MIFHHLYKYVLISLMGGLLIASPVYAQRIPQNRAEVNISFAPLVQKTAPAVVNIYAKKIVTERTSLFSNPFFEQFFGQQFGATRQRIANSLGSGVILSKRGLIVTNAHVIDGAEEIVVVLANGREYQARLLLQDKRTDLAMLQIDSKDDLPYLDYGDSDALAVGDLVLAIGNPFSVGQTVTSGIISALARSAHGVSDYRSFIQTDAAINPGNSGGALVDVAGKLIGINTAIYSKTGESLGIGFAVPVNMVRIVADYAIRGEEIIRPWTGLSGKEIDWDLAQALDLEFPGGVLVENIYPRSPGDRAGIKVQDVIMQIDGYQFTNVQDLRFRLALKKPGDKIKLRGVSDGRPQQWRLLLQAPPETPKRKTTELTGNHVLNGAIIENLSPKVNNEISKDVWLTGVVIRQIVANAAAIRYGFQPGDIVLDINDTPINKVSDVVAVLKIPAESYKITIDRNGRKVQQNFR